MLAVGRSIHSASIVRNSTLSMPSSAARAGELDHRLGGVGADERAARRDQLGDEQAGVAGTGRELEHAVAGLGRDRVDEPGRDRLPRGLQDLPVGLPSSRRARPALEARAAIGGRVAHQPFSANLTTRLAFGAEFPNAPAPSVP